MDMQNSISAEADQHAARAREQREQADADEKTKRETVRADKPETYFLYRDDRMENAYSSATEAMAGLKEEAKNNRERLYIGDSEKNSYAEKKAGERLSDQGYSVPTWGIETSPEFKQDLAQEEAIRERETISEERPSAEREGQELARQREFEEKLGKWETELIGHDEGHQGLENLARQEVRQEQEFEEREQAYEPDMSQEQEDAARDRQEERQMQEFEEEEERKIQEFEDPKRAEAFAVITQQMQEITGYSGTSVFRGQLEDAWGNSCGISFDDVLEQLSPEDLALVEEAFDSNESKFYSHLKEMDHRAEATARQEATAHKRPENAFAELRAATEKFDAVKDQMQKHDPKGWDAKLDAAIKASPNPVMPQRQAWDVALEKTNPAPSPVIAQELAPWQKQLAAEAQPPTQEAERQAEMQRQQEIETPGR